VIGYEPQGRTVLITLDGEGELNLGAVGPELHAKLTEYRDDPELWCAVVTGAGERAFSAGANLKGNRPGWNTSVWQARALDMLTGGEFNKPLIAAINGYCLGAGMMLALGCDVRIATDSATFGLPELRYGFPPGMGSTWRLTRAIPLGPAMEMILTGDRISAVQALQWGLINRIVPAAELAPEALKLAERITANPPLAVQASKELALRGLEMRFDEHLRLQAMMSSITRQTEDAKEGARAFAEKRKPEFKGR
jgi:(E)-benzylidenesuccinyl-CoA hydratase